MRRVALVTALMTALTVTGCGAHTGPGGSDHATDAEIAGWTALSKNFNGFYAATATRHLPATAPVTTRDYLDWVGYKFTDGVKLAEFNTTGACLTGPNDTYLTLSAHDTFKRSFGTGDCDDTGGDIVLVEGADENSTNLAKIAATSDAANLAGLIVNTYIFHPGQILTSLDEKWLARNHFSLSNGNRITKFVGDPNGAMAQPPDDVAFKFCILSGSGAYAAYDSAKGHLMVSGYDSSQGMTSGTDGSCSFDPSHNTSDPAGEEPFTEKVVKGEALAKQIPNLNGWVETLRTS